MKSPLTHVQSLLEPPDPQPDKALIELTSMTSGENTPWPVLHFIGMAYLLKQDFEAALRWLQKAVKAGDTEAMAYYALSICYHAQNAFDKAEKYGKQALEKKNFYSGWMHLAAVYRAQAKLKEALDCYKRAVKIEPENTGITHQIAEIYQNNGRLDKALELFESMADMDDQNLAAYGAMAQILIKKRQFDEAEEYLNLILKERPDHVSTKIVYSDLFRQRGDYEKAVEICENLIKEDPSSPARLNYAVCLQELGRFDEAEENYLKALKDTPNRYQCFSSYLMSIHYNPQKTKQEIFEAHKQWDQLFAPDKRPNRPMPAVQGKDKKLRIGLLSGGFQCHPVGWMITGGLEHLPPDQFEIYCYTTSSGYDQITNRISETADQWRSVVGYSDEVIARMIRDDEIDILIELSGHASDNRLRTVILEPAPVIAKWVGGLFNTTGLQSVDYLITDGYESPAGEEEFYTEKLVRMPDDYISYLPPSYAPEIIESPPAEKNGYLTFGCFNNPSKINEKILARWAEVMTFLPESRLLLKSKQYDTEALRERIVAMMEQEGIAKDRIIFKGQTNHKDHLSCYNQVDIALDPWPYSGGLTTCEALWMGVPVITKPGATFAGRHSTTHLINAGFSNWVADTWKEYVEKSVALAKDMERLSELRSSMRQQIAESPLCNGRRFAAHLSMALREMWKQRIDGYEKDQKQWQDHINVEALSEEEVEKNSVATRIITDKQNTEEPAGKAASERASNLCSNSTPALARSAGRRMHPTDKETVSSKGVVLPPEHEKLAPKELHSRRNGDEKPDVFNIETKGGVTICTPPDLHMLTPYVLLEQEQWFEPELDFVREYVKPGMNILDIGAGFGAYTLPMAQLAGSKGRVYGFEPGAVAYRHLEMSKLKNGFENLQIIKRAVADQTGEAKWQVADTPELSKLDEQSSETVSRTTLDAWWQFAGNLPLDFIKIDANGDEADVLAGAEGLLSKQSPVILLAVGERGMKNIHAAEETLEKKEYKLYEYTQGLQLLSEYNAHEKTDPYLMNLFAFKENRAEELKKSGWLYEDGIELDEPEEGYWKNVLCKLPWTESVFSQWQKQANSSQQEDYLRALDHLCLAEKIDPDANASNRSKRAALTLKAVDILVQYYNDGNTGIPVALTLARGLNMLGKRGLAVEVMKSVLETNTLGKEDINIDLPFLLPLPEQDQSPVQTNFKQWLTVRIVEAWIQLKDVSTYFSGEEELKLLEKLEGNPENQSHLGKLVILMRQRKGKKYFSQFGEDIILEKLLKPQQAKGFYIDIGAFHPHKYSNTALMNLFGWSGINIDANEKAINTFNRVRPNDINLYAAITETDGEVEFFMADRLGEVNTLSNTHKEMWENRGITYKTKKVPSRRLDSLLSEHIDPTVAIDFMNIDVEDAEMGVLNSNDWTKYRPKVIAIEIIMHGPNEQTVYDSEVAGFLRDQGYKYITYKKLTAFFQDTSVQKPTLSVTGSNELSLNKTKNENVNRNSYLQKNIEEKDKILFDLLMDYEKRTGYMSEKLIFKKIHGYYPDLSNPKTFNEKVLYKKIFDRNPLLPKIADKLLVREYVKQKLGSEGAGILIPLLFHSKKPIEIPFESFEEDFIVKPNHSCGMYKMIQKGSKFDTNKLRNLCRHWLEIPHGIKAYEWAYQPINRKIIVEKLLLNENNKIPKDYKFFVFNGKCKWVKVDHDRFEHHTSTVYDENWNYLSVTRVNPKGVIEPKPIHFDVMKRYAEILGSELDFVRVDLYLVKSQIYFGELTNYPMSGRAIIKPKEWDVKLGNYWNINY